MANNTIKQKFPNNNRVREILHNAFSPMYDNLGDEIISHTRENIHSLIYHLSIDTKSEFHGLLSNEIDTINNIYNLFGDKDFVKLIRKSVSKPKAQKPETSNLSGENKTIQNLKELNQYIDEQYKEERQNYKNLWNEYLKVSSELAGTKRELEHLKQQTSHE